MLKKLVLWFSIAVFSFPAFTFADDTANTQLVSLYTKLVELLKQELIILQSQSQSKSQESLTGRATLSISPNNGVVPLAVVFTLTNKNATESIDFGDGHSTGSAGCVRNAKNWCDLPDNIPHTYSYPGNYKVTLYDHPIKDSRVILTTTVSVSSK